MVKEDYGGGGFFPEKGRDSGPVGRACDCRKGGGNPFERVEEGVVKEDRGGGSPFE